MHRGDVHLPAVRLRELPPPLRSTRAEGQRVTPIHHTTADDRRQAETARILDQAWGCAHHAFPEFHPIDWFAIRRGQVVHVAELKCREHPHDKHDTVFLAMRKWLWLINAYLAGTRALFVARFTDQIRWIDVTWGMGELALRGTQNGKIGREGKEPVILVPVDSMRVVPQPAAPATPPRPVRRPALSDADLNRLAEEMP